MKKIKMKAGLDIGNGYVKGGVNIDNTGVVPIYSPSSISYTSAKVVDQDVNAENTSNFINSMDATIISKSVPVLDQDRAFFGTRGVVSGQSLKAFDISNDTPKCNDSLSTILIAGVIASSAIEYLFKKDGRLDNDIIVYAAVATALPIQDYIEYKNAYEKILTSNEHVVHVHNFEKDIVVKIVIEKAVIVAEGAAAQFAINSFTDAQCQKVAKDSEIKDPNLIKNSANTISVDIGEGTVNFPVFLNNKVVGEVSRSIDVGYGTILSRVIESTRNQNGAFKSRKQLADFMQGDVVTFSEPKRITYEMYERRIAKECKGFVRDIMAEFNKIFSEVGVQIDTVYVYGGGSGPMRAILEDALREASRVGNSFIPVVYISEVYANELNRNGLYSIIEAVTK